jgi:hypothetical protein
MLRFKKQPLSGGLYLARTVATFVVYWIVTHENPISRVIGVYSVITCAVIFGIGHGILNAYFVLSASRPSKQVPPPAVKTDKVF